MPSKEQGYHEPQDRDPPAARVQSKQVFHVAGRWLVPSFQVLAYQSALPVHLMSILLTDRRSLSLDDLTNANKETPSESSQLQGLICHAIVDKARPRADI